MLKFTVSVKHGWIIFISPNSKNGLRPSGPQFFNAKKLFILRGGECFLLLAIHPILLPVNVRGSPFDVVVKGVFL
ncbi:MAG: hypothetical protein J6Q41_04345 [Firmicutes bacterium]|nr:hypothetical protein [Bacillota bacterium]